MILIYLYIQFAVADPSLQPPDSCSNGTLPLSQEAIATGRTYKYLKQNIVLET